jgi:hypothetical protein
MVIHPRVFRGGSWDDDAEGLRSEPSPEEQKKFWQMVLDEG